MPREYKPIHNPTHYRSSTWGLFVNFIAGNYFENGQEKDPARAEDLQQLIGYARGAYALGYVDDLRDPIEVLRPGGGATGFGALNHE